MASRAIASVGKLLIGIGAVASGAIMPGAAQQALPPPIDYNQPGNRKPTEMDKLKIVATEINGRRSECYERKDAACAAAVFTEDATFIELQPQLRVLKGRAQIQRIIKNLSMLTQRTHAYRYNRVNYWQGNRFGGWGLHYRFERQENRRPLLPNYQAGCRKMGDRGPLLRPRRADYCKRRERLSGQLTSPACDYVWRVQIRAV